LDSITAKHSVSPGVDIWIEDVHGGACLRIRERRRVNVGHVAMGISDQVRSEVKGVMTIPVLFV